VKAASAATLAILAGGQYVKFEFYTLTLPNLAQSFYFTNADVSLTVGGHTWLTGLSIVRSAFTQAVGLAVQSVDLTIEPQADNPAGAVTLGGAGFLSACRAGAFDGGIITISKGFFLRPAAGAQMDLSPGIVKWFAGIVDQVQVGRFTVDITVNDLVQVLNVQMPRNILQSGCVHALFDAGCTLNKAANTNTNSIVSGLTANGFTSSSAKPLDFYTLGVVTFTSGVLNGSSYAVSRFLAGGAVVFVVPFAAMPSIGDTYSWVPGCDKSQAMCASGKFIIGGVGASNLAHYRGAPYVPQPETLYDGGTQTSAAPSVGGQGGQGAGSSFSGALGKSTYVA
jgi:hypothetical protein